MAGSSCMHRRKRRTRYAGEHRKRNDKYYLFATPLTLVALFVALLIANMHQCELAAGGKDEKNNRGELTTMLKQCRSSCDNILHSKTSSELSSPLSSWAMDALILIRDENNRGKQQRAEHNALHRTPRPIRLPPLIEILVGSDEFSYNTAAESANSGGNTANSGSGHRLISGSGNDNTVAFAAAAAAAVWSERRGGYRMKTLNEEWDGALRWIADWGTSENSSSLKHRNRSRGQSKTRLVKGQGKKEASQHMSNLLSACVEKCLGEYEEQHYGKKNGESLRTILGNHCIYLLDTLLLPLPFLCASNVAFEYVLRLLASTICLATARVVVMMWLKYPSERMPQWIVDELHGGHCETWINGPQNQRKNVKRGGKKKKSSPRRCCATLNEKKTIEGHVPVSPSESAGNDGLLTTIVNREGSQQVVVQHACSLSQGHSSDESVVTEQTSDTVTNEIKAPQDHLPPLNTISLQVGESESMLLRSNGCNERSDTSSASVSTSESSLNNEQQCISESKISGTRRAALSSTRVNVNRRNSRQAKGHKSSKNKRLRTKEVHRGNPTHDSDSKNKRDKRKSSEEISMQTDLSDHESPRLLNGLAIPTKQQREEASRRLREYQTAQIAKIIRKREQRDDKLQVRDEIKSLYPDLHREMIANITVPGIAPTQQSLWSYNEHAFTHKTIIPPPPGIAWPSDDTEDTSSQATDDCFLGDDLLLSNMLEDDDDYCPSDNSIQNTLPVVSNDARTTDTVSGFQVQVGSGREPTAMGLLEYRRGFGENELELWNRNATARTTANFTSTWGSSDCGSGVNYVW